MWVMARGNTEKVVNLNVLKWILFVSRGLWMRGSI